MDLIKTYSELIQLPTFLERYEYLKLNGVVGKETFGFERYLNQILYSSYDWKLIRRDIIARDLGCDLGIKGHEIFDYIMVHHINPITVEDIKRHHPKVYDQENLISTSRFTHRAIHYGDKSQLRILPLERRKGDTTPWKVY